MVEVAGVVPSEGTERQDRSAQRNRTTVVRWTPLFVKNGEGGGSRTRVSLVFTRGIVLYLSHRADVNLYPPYPAIKITGFSDNNLTIMGRGFIPPTFTTPIV